MVVLRNADGAILAEAGGRQVYQDRYTRYSDYNRVTGSRRQPGSAFKPLLFLAAFRQGLDLDTLVPDEPISVPLGARRREVHRQLRQSVQGPDSHPPGAGRVAQRGGRLARPEDRRGRDDPDGPRAGDPHAAPALLSTALGASEVALLELASAYRAIASEVLAEPYVIARVHDASGGVLYEAPRRVREIGSPDLRLIQEGLRGVIRLPNGTAHALDGRDFPIPVMGKTGTTSDFRDALFVGSTYGRTGITVAVRIGFDDNRGLGDQETGGRAALPIFREIMLRVYRDELVGPVAGISPGDRGRDRSSTSRGGLAPEVGREEPAATRLRRRAHRLALGRPAGDVHRRASAPLPLVRQAALSPPSPALRSL